MNPPARTANVTPSTTAVKAAPGQLVAVLAVYGSAATTVTVYDHASAASGTVLAQLKPASGSTQAWTPPTPQLAQNGITVKVDGTAALAIVVYH